MTRISIIVLLVFMAGCVTVELPKLLEAKDPYRENFDADFNRTFAATVTTLEKMGWKISDTESPSIPKVDQIEVPQSNNTTRIITETKQRSLILTSTYLTLNIYVRALDANKSEVEVRYLSITVIPPFFKQWRVTKNDGLVEKLYKKISENLKY